ncbi:MAG: hypothetical protein U0Z26_02770 [Anaerolineales bacterium]
MKRSGGLSKLNVALVTVLGIISVAYISGGNMFSPGSLSVASGIPMSGVSSHSQIQECASCHVAPWDTDTMADRCLACHSDISQQLLRSDSLHSLARASQLDLNCRACHIEHLGEMAKITKMPLGWNPHDQLGFSLKAHTLHADGSLFECKDCHVNGLSQKMDQIVCANCHLQLDIVFAQPHILTFWTNCTACHDGLDSHGSSFNHNLVEFPLMGQHAQTACFNCHVNARTLNDLKATPQSCYFCHKKDDIHEGQLGIACANCHTPDSWKSAHVDHSQFAFKLDGKHATVVCENCHHNNVFKETPTDCAACHLKDDAHAGRLGSQCGTCHTPSGWSPASFDHDTVGFSLNSHQIIKQDGSAFACKDCHTQGYAMAMDQTICGSCHLQINQAFSVQHFINFGTNCMACHDGVDSHGSNFNHNMVAFPLLGKHAMLGCSKCHIAARTLSDLKNAPQDCFSCHVADDRHNGQFGVLCSNCHSPDGWSLAAVDHSQFSFHLEGKHASVACENCHFGGVFKGTPSDCMSCHSKSDPHGGALGNLCSTCHTTLGWKPSLFDHSKSNFPLTGSHGSVQCDSCHANLTFKGTPSNCYACHAKNDHHGGANGTSCDACHNTTSWNSVTFNHAFSAFPLTGAHATVSCDSCHKNGVYAGVPTACSSCHGEPMFHLNAFGTDCSSCHGTSTWQSAVFNKSHPSIANDDGVNHGGATCKTCHTTTVFSATCTACHNNNGGGDGKGGGD